MLKLFVYILRPTGQNIQELWEETGVQRSLTERLHGEEQATVGRTRRTDGR